MSCVHNCTTGGATLGQIDGKRLEGGFPDCHPQPPCEVFDIGHSRRDFHSFPVISFCFIIGAVTERLGWVSGFVLGGGILVGFSEPTSCRYNLKPRYISLTNRLFCILLAP